jgi:broad specificity phosphatase PhoE/ribonuclease HI
VTRRLIVEADGGSRGNPGVAGYGALVREAATGEVLARRAAPLGMASNNVAEYTGLIVGLEAAAAIDPGAHVEARLDSKLVVEQLSGRWKIKHEDMRRLALQAREVIRTIEAGGGQVRMTWVPREKNRDADALSNEAMDGRTIRWDAPLDTTSPESDAEPVETGPVETGPVETGPVAAEQVATEPAPTLRPAATDPVSAAVGNAFEPDLGSPTRIVLVRHGVTDFTTAGRLDGRGGADPSLSATGRAQALCAARAVAALVDPAETVVISSALARGRETGQIIADALALTAVVDPDWDEQGFGDWDGSSMAELIAAEPQTMRRFRDDPHYSRPGGESHAQLLDRVDRAFAAAVARGGTVVVATHRKPVLAVLSSVLGLPHGSFWTLATAPASLTAIQVWRDGTTQIAFVNRTSHLGG